MSTRNRNTVIIDGRRLRHIATLTDGLCDGQHFRWVTAPPRHEPDHNPGQAMADALRAAGVPLCRHGGRATTCDLHVIFRAVADGVLVIGTLHGPGGSTWIDVPAGGDAAARIEAVLASLPGM